MVSLQKSFSIADQIPFLTPTVSVYRFRKITSHKIKKWGQLSRRYQNSATKRWCGDFKHVHHH